jgi:hypothetical protein
MTEGPDCVSIHRLLQKGIKDEMSEADLKTIVNEFFEIRFHAFPRICDNLTHSICRRYSVQVYQSPIELNPVPCRSAKNADVLICIGRFLLDHGNAKDGEALFRVACTTNWDPTLRLG